MDRFIDELIIANKRTVAVRNLRFIMDEWACEAIHNAAEEEKRVPKELGFDLRS